MSVLAAYGGAGWGIVRRDARLFLSYRLRLVSQLATVFFSISLFYYVSRLVHVSTFSSSDAYFGYAVVGIVTLEVIGASLAGLPPMLRQELVAGTFERLVLSPAGAVATTVAMSLPSRLRSEIAQPILSVREKQVLAMVVMGKGRDDACARRALTAVAAQTIAAERKPCATEASLSGRSQPPPVRITDVTRRFQGRTALAGVSIEVSEGEIHALLGPNGAGKTTLLRIVGGLMHPSEGTVEILGRDHRRYGRLLRQQIGLVPSGSRSFYLRISALENLVFFGRMYGLRRREAERRAREVLDDVGLAQSDRVRVQAMSTGMQRRLATARALLADPRVLLIDEATHDLDPRAAAQIRALVRQVTDERGVAVLWATQRVEEIRGFADKVTVLDRGIAAFSGSVTGFLRHATASRFIVRLNGAQPTALDAIRRCLEDHADVDRAEGDEEQFLIQPRATSPLGNSLDALSAGGYTVVSCTEERPGAEQAFLKLTESL